MKSSVKFAAYGIEYEPRRSLMTELAIPMGPGLFNRPERVNCQAVHSMNSSQSEVNTW